eukprot:4749681-Pyramimonas_sp.AAC.1
MSTVSPGVGLEARGKSVLDWGPKIRARRVGLLIEISTANFRGDIPQSFGAVRASDPRVRAVGEDGL